MKTPLSLFAGALIGALLLTQVGCRQDLPAPMPIGFAPMFAQFGAGAGGGGSVKLTTLLDTSNALFSAISGGSGVTNAIKDVYANGTQVGDDVTSFGFSNSPSITWGSYSNNGAVTLTGTAVAGTGSGAIVGSNAPVIDSLSVLSSGDVTGEFNIHAETGTTLNLFEVFDSAGLAQVNIRSNGVVDFKEDVWVWTGSSLNFGTPGSSLGVSISATGIEAPTMDATFDDVALDRISADLSITNLGLTHLDGDVLAPNITSNTSPVNTVGQLADGSLVKIANAVAGSGTNSTQMTNGVAVTSNTDTVDRTNSPNIKVTGTASAGRAVISYDLNDSISLVSAVFSGDVDAETFTWSGGGVDASGVVSANAGDFGTVTATNAIYNTLNITESLTVTNINTNAAYASALTIYGNRMFNTFSVTSAVTGNLTFTFESVHPGAEGRIHLKSDGSARTVTFVFAGGTRSYATNTSGLAGTNFTTAANGYAVIGWAAGQILATETNLSFAARNFQ